MTYSMLSMAENDPRALLDPETLEQLAQRTFSTFFQHYASNNVTFAAGGRTYQKINETLPPDIGKSETYGKRQTTESIAPSVSGNSANVDVSRPIVVLRTSKTAVWICIVILSWLIVTALLLAVFARSHTSSFEKKIETVGDIAILVTASDEFLELVKNSRHTDLKQNTSLRTRLEHFTSIDGEDRYGINLCSPDDISEASGQNKNYRQVPSTETPTLQSDDQWQTPKIRIDPAPYADLRLRHSRHSRHVSGTSARSASPQQRFVSDDGDIALLPLDRSQLQHEERHSEDPGYGYREDDDSMQLSAEELAAVEYMRQTGTHYHEASLGFWN